LLQDALKVDSLTKYFDGHLVIDHLSFRLQRGKRMALYAPSGAGKTTLIKILAGLETYDGGRFELIDAVPVTIFQEPRLFAYMTVEENILLPFRLHKITPSSDLWRHYQNWLEVCELDAYTHHFPWQLSGGMKQR
jgi:ABC-type nitrate/sulfonate/bicarbonate transport system ATPase subunit